MAAHNYTEEEKKEIVDRICDIISEQGESLRSALNYHDMPARKTFFEWIDKNDDYRNQYARACEERADKIFEEIIEIADSKNADVTVSDEGKIIIDGNAIQRDRLRVDARKWAAGKMNPKKYGDKIDVTSDNKALPVTQPIWQVVDASKK